VDSLPKEGATICGVLKFVPKPVVHAEGLLKRIQREIWVVRFVQGVATMPREKGGPAHYWDASPRRSSRPSHVRMRSAVSPPSSIPPAPLPSASSLAGLEWWIDAHMTVASNLLCLEQMLDKCETAGGSNSDPHVVFVARSLAPLTDLRDALYELYCDASDVRMRPLTTLGGPIAMYVCALYAACDEILEALMGLVSETLRGKPRVADAVAEAEERCKAFASASSELSEGASRALARIAVDLTNPVDPLRSAAQNLQNAIEAAARLVEASSQVSDGR
jgi:hypothetical protein